MKSVHKRGRRVNCMPFSTFTVWHTDRQTTTVKGGKQVKTKIPVLAQKQERKVNALQTLN